MGGDTIKATNMVKGIGMVKGLDATSPILDAKQFVAGQRFLTKYRAAFKADRAYGGHYTDNAMYVLAGAMKRAELSDARKITDTRRTLYGYAPITGSMKWDAVGKQRYGVVGVYSAPGGNRELQLRSDRW